METPLRYAPLRFHAFGGINIRGKNGNFNCCRREKIIDVSQMGPIKLVGAQIDFSAGLKLE